MGDSSARSRTDQWGKAALAAAATVFGLVLCSLDYSSRQQHLWDMRPDILLSSQISHVAKQGISRPVELAQITRPQMPWTTSQLPSISSSCLDMPKKGCTIAVPGGSLLLSGITSEKGSDKPIQAEVSGRVNGRYVSGIVTLNPANRALSSPPVKRIQYLKQNTGDTAVSGTSTPKAVHKTKKTALQSSVGGNENQQYQLALAAVEKHMLARQRKIEAEAKKIAEAVTKEITSPAVSQRIAHLAMEAAAVKGHFGTVFPLRQAVEGAVGLAANSFGYAAQPAGSYAPSAQQLAIQRSNEQLDRANAVVEGPPMDVSGYAPKRPYEWKQRVALQGAPLGVQMGDVDTFEGPTRRTHYKHQLNRQAKGVRSDMQIAQLKKVATEAVTGGGGQQAGLPDPWVAFSQFEGKV